MRLIDAEKLFDEVGRIKPKNKQHYKDIGTFMNMITNSSTIEPKSKQEPCDDAISRQAVLDLIVANHTELNGISVVMYLSLCKDIKQLPPVNPQGQEQRCKNGELAYESRRTDL